MRRLPRGELAVSAKTPRGWWRSPDIEGLAHGTRVPGVRVPSVTWGLLSSVVLTRYLRSLIGIEEMVFEENFDDSAQCASGGKARLSGMSGVRCLLRPGDQQSAVADFPPTTHRWELFQPRVGGAARPSTLQMIIVDDDFEHTTDGITTYTGRGYRWFCPVCGSNFKVLLVGVFLGGVNRENRISCLYSSRR